MSKSTSVVDLHKNTNKNPTKESTIVAKIKDSALPGPLGLLGFGMTTILLNIHNAGFMPISAMILAMGLFYGGIAQVIAGVLEYKKANTFGYMAFTSYGLFWLSLVFILIAPKMGIAEAADSFSMGWFLFMWGLFTAFMYVGVSHKNATIKFIFSSLTVLFFLLAARDWTGSELIGTIAGIEGIICGASAFYLGMAEMLEDVKGRKVLPY